MKERTWNPRMDACVAAAADLYGLTVGIIYSGARTPTVVNARTVATLIARRRWGFSTTELDQFMGITDSARRLKRGEEMCKKDERLRSYVEQQSRLSIAAEALAS